MRKLFLFFEENFARGNPVFMRYNGVSLLVGGHSFSSAIYVQCSSRKLNTSSAQTESTMLTAFFGKTNALSAVSSPRLSPQVANRRQLSFILEIRQDDHTIRGIFCFEIRLNGLSFIDQRAPEAKA
jgi:hypothetical protein